MKKKEKDNWKKEEKETTNFLFQQAKDMWACQKKSKKCDYTCLNHNSLVSQKEKKWSSRVWLEKGFIVVYYEVPLSCQ